MRLRQRRRGARHASGAAVALLALTVSGPARADLHEMAGRVAADWRAAGAETTLLPTRFLFDEESVVVPIPPEPAGPEGDDGEPRCTRIAVLGARHRLGGQQRIDGRVGEPRPEAEACLLYTSDAADEL